MLNNNDKGDRQLSKPQSKLHIQIQTEVVRNEIFHLTNGEFLLYARLSFLWFRNFKNNEIPLDHKNLMLNIGITDTRTLKKRLDRLYECNLILNKVERFPRRGEVIIQFNSNPFESKHFTMLPATLFNHMDRIDEHSFRLLFYYKSYINSNNDNDFCFVGFKTMCEHLKMSPNTIDQGNDSLIKHKLLKIKRHKLETTYEYGLNDELIYNRYNNHYYVRENNI